jgi:hypothetical protein
MSFAMLKYRKNSAQSVDSKIVLGNFLSADSQGFETGTGQFTLTSYARDNTQAKAGSWSISVSVPSGSVSSQAITPEGTSGFPITPGTTYQLTAHHAVYASGVLSSQPRIRLKFFDSGGTLTHTASVTNVVSVNGEGFKKFGFKVTAPTGTAYMSVFLQSATAQSGTRQAYFDEISLAQITEPGDSLSVQGQFGGAIGQAAFHSTSGHALPFTVSSNFSCTGIALHTQNLSGGLYLGIPQTGYSYASGSTAVEAVNARAGISSRITTVSGHTTSTVPWLASVDIDTTVNLNILNGWTYCIFSSPLALTTSTQYSMTVVEIPGLSRPGSTVPSSAITPVSPTGNVSADGNLVTCSSTSFTSSTGALMPHVKFLGV